MSNLRWCQNVELVITMEMFIAYEWVVGEVFLPTKIIELSRLDQLTHTASCRPGAVRWSGPAVSWQGWSLSGHDQGSTTPTHLGEMVVG